MKLIKTILFLLLPLSLLAQGGFPVVTKGRPAILQTEGDGVDLTMNVASGTATVGVTINYTSKVVPYGFQADVAYYTVISDGPANVVGYVRNGNGSNGNEKAVTPINKNFGDTGGIWEFPINNTIYGGGHILLAVTATTTTKPNIKAFASPGKMISDDRHYSAPLVYTSFGNSISWGTLGNRALGSGYPNPGKTHFSRRINSALRLAGIDVRPSMRGFGGSQAKDWIRQIDSGVYDDQPLDLVTIMLGTNEAADGDSSLVEASSGMKYSQMMEYIVDWIYTRKPTASVVILGPPHSSSSPRIINLPTIRAATAKLVTLQKYAGKDLFYYDVTGNIAAPTVANDPNYVEVGTGTHIHLRGDTGHALIYQGLWPIIQQTKFYTNNVNLAKPLDP